MNKIQKIALFNLIAAFIGLSFQGVRLISGAARLLRIFASTANLIICCFIVASRILIVIIKKRGEKYYDERDKLIAKRAGFTGLVTAFLVFFSEVMICFLIAVARPSSSISIGLVFNLFLVGAFSLFFAESLVVLIQYGRGSKGEKL
ncbi:hypothetical protein ACFL1G_10660 [Planctomycetota bacterium]